MIYFLTFVLILSWVGHYFAMKELRGWYDIKARHFDTCEAWAKSLQVEVDVLHALYDQLEPTGEKVKARAAVLEFIRVSRTATAAVWLGAGASERYAKLRREFMELPTRVLNVR
jgi:hypothetical protein